VYVWLSELEVMETDWKWFKFSIADYEALIQKLNFVDWHDIFSRKRVNQCTNLFYDVIW
jgi:hypothetical protein